MISIFHLLFILPCTIGSTPLSQIEEVKYSHLRLDIDLHINASLNQRWVPEPDVYTGRFEVREKQSWTCTNIQAEGCKINLERKFKKESLTNVHICGAFISKKAVNFSLSDSKTERSVKIDQPVSKNAGDVTLCWHANQLNVKRTIPNPVKPYALPLPMLITLPIIYYLETSGLEFGSVSTVTWSRDKRSSAVYLMGDTISLNNEYLWPCRVKYSSNAGGLDCSPPEDKSEYCHKRKTKTILSGIFVDRVYTGLPEQCLKLFVKYGSLKPAYEIHWIDIILSRHLLETYLAMFIVSITLGFCLRSVSRNDTQNPTAIKVLLFVCIIAFQLMLAAVTVTLLNALPLGSCAVMYHNELKSPLAAVVFILLLYHYPAALVTVIFFPTKKHGLFFPSVDPNPSDYVQLSLIQKHCPLNSTLYRISSGKWYRIFEFQVIHLHRIMSIGCAVYMVSLGVFPYQQVPLMMLLVVVSEWLGGFLTDSKKSLYHQSYSEHDSDCKYILRANNFQVHDKIQGQKV